MKNNLFAGAEERAQTKRRDTVGFEVPAPPATCSRMGCNNETVVAMAVVRERNATLVVPGSEVLGAGRVLRSGYEWVDWIGRCAECYSRDMARSGRGVYSEASRDHVLTIEDVKAWQERSRK